MLQLNAEQTARELLQDGSGYFNAVFFTHSTSRMNTLSNEMVPLPCEWTGRRPVEPGPVHSAAVNPRPGIR
jgi:hypothetical protein